MTAFCPHRSCDLTVIVLSFSRLSILSGSGGHSSSLWYLCRPCVKWGHRRKIQNTQEMALCVEARRWWSCLTLDQSKIPRGVKHGKVSLGLISCLPLVSLFPSAHSSPAPTPSIPFATSVGPIRRIALIIACVCLSVCLSVVHPPSAQVLQPILIKLGQMDHWGT